MSDAPEVKPVRRTCRWCGRTFTAVKGQAKGRGCPDCEPPLDAAPPPGNGSKRGEQVPS